MSKILPLFSELRHDFLLLVCKKVLETPSPLDLLRSANLPGEGVRKEGTFMNFMSTFPTLLVQSSSSSPVLFAARCSFWEVTSTMSTSVYGGGWRPVPYETLVEQRWKIPFRAHHSL
jgi:hypothetical protein